MGIGPVKAEQTCLHGWPAWEDFLVPGLFHPEMTSDSLGSVRSLHRVPPHKRCWTPDPQYLKCDSICSRVFAEFIKLKRGPRVGSKMAGWLASPQEVRVWMKTHIGRMSCDGEGRERVICPQAKESKVSQRPAGGSERLPPAATASTCRPRDRALLASRAARWSFSVIKAPSLKHFATAAPGRCPGPCPASLGPAHPQQPGLLPVLA